MKRVLICLQVILFSFIIGISSVFADEYLVDISDTDISASIDTDNFSSVNLETSIAEISEEVEVVVTLTDYLGNPITDHSVRIYIDGDDTGVTLTQPDRSDQRGEAVGSIQAENAGMYKVMAVDDTYGYDIDIVSFDIFYAVPLDVPSLFEEPYYTKGIKNTLVWTDEFGYQYYIEASTSSSFDVVASNSGWISSSQYTFNDLEGSTMYFFRLKKRNAGGGESGWSESVYSVQDNTSPVITFISIENRDTSSSTSDDFLEIKAKIEDNLSLYSQVTYCVLSDDSLSECTSSSSLDGSIYTSNISLDDLEKDENGNLLDSYFFCIEATDEAGNISRNCDIEIVLKTEEESTISESENEEINIENLNFSTFFSLPVTAVNLIQSALTSSQILLLDVVILLVILLVVFTIFFGSIPTIFIYKYYFITRIFRRGNFVINGKVYDSQTKENVRYPIVQILNKEGKRINVLVGNSKGEFKARVNEKEVTIKVSKNNFVFPSVFVTEKTDYPLENVYLGKNLKLKLRQENIISIPIDREERNLWKIVLNIFKYILLIFSLYLFIIGLFFDIYLLRNTFSIYSLAILLIYIFDVLLLLKYLVSMYHRIGRVKDEEGNVVKGIDIVVRDRESMKILYRRVSDIYGRYSFELDKGEYILDILNKEYELVAVEGGREFDVEEKERCIKDLIVGKLKKH